MNSLLEAPAACLALGVGQEDGQALLWPPPPEAYARLAKAAEARCQLGACEEITLRATRGKYDDAWFENILEVLERFGSKMQKNSEKEMHAMAQISMQRLVTEWLRHDSLWEDGLRRLSMRLEQRIRPVMAQETAEGRFLSRLMSLSHEQWEQQPLGSTWHVSFLSLS